MTQHCAFPVPANEEARRQLMAGLDLRDRRDDPFFAHVTALARHLFGTPIAFISLIHGDVQEFLAIDGSDVQQTPRSMSMCAYTVAAKRTIVSADTHDDPRFATHPIVAQPPHLRFSASAPVILSSGFCLGTVCAVDVVPHDTPTPAQIAALELLAAMTARFYEVPSQPDPAEVARRDAIAQGAQEAFLALIGHELRTPLNGINGMAQCLEPHDESEREVAEAILSSATHLDAVVATILAFTELRSGDIQLSEKTFDLDALLDRVLRAFRAEARLRGTTIAMPAPTGLQLTADSAKIEMALTCLVANVLAHGGAALDIALHRDADGHLSLIITDDGQGIEPARADTIWQAFGVGADVHRRTADGLGLGLPLTRRIAELHGGAFTLAPADPGLRATLTLPQWRIHR